MSADLFPSARPTDLHELIGYIGQVVRERHAKDNRPTDGSYLAHALRERYPQLDYAAVGINRLGDAVAFAEAEGLVTRHRDVKHLVLSPPTGQGPTPEARPHVKSDVWRAVVLTPTKTTYINRDTYDVAEDGENTEQNAALVRVNAVSGAQQAHWAKMFSKAYPADLNAESPAVINALVRGGGRSYPPHITKSWVNFRAAKIIEHIREWARKAELDEARILLPPESRKRKLPPAPPTQQSPPGSLSWRNAIVAVIQEMSDEELDRLVLPVRHIRRHFAPK